MKWCDLETNKKKFQLMVKEINAENLELRYNSGISQEYKIDNIIEIKKKDWTVLNICKIELESKEDYERLLQEETIKLGLFNYKVEKYTRVRLVVTILKNLVAQLKCARKKANALNVENQVMKTNVKITNWDV